MIRKRLTGFDWARFCSRAIATLLILGFVFALGLYSGGRRTWVFRASQATVAHITDAFVTLAGEASTLTGRRPKHFLQRKSYASGGVTVNHASDTGLVFLSGFFDGSNELRLVQRDGTIVNRWPVVFSRLFPDVSHLSKPPATDWNIDTHGAMALPDGSVVFNFDWGGLVKLDRCNNVVWTVRRQTHHSVEQAEGGGFWVPGRRTHAATDPSPFPPFSTPLHEDTILRISDDGRVLQEISVPRLFYDNGLTPVLTTHLRDLEGDGGTGELLHVNKISELKREVAPAFPDFAAGDLLLSDRAHNLLFVVDPRAQRIKWWQIGPWQRQHDPEFTDMGTFVVFDNNTYALRNDDDKMSKDAAARSRIVEIDPRTRGTRIRYGASESEAFLSVIRGKVQWKNTGHLLITEFEGGRAFEVDRHGRTIWEYVNRYDEHYAAEISEALFYPHGYFTVTEWACDSDAR
jgi:hypothetical protein